MNIHTMHSRENSSQVPELQLVSHFSMMDHPAYCSPANTYPDLHSKAFQKHPQGRDIAQVFLSVSLLLFGWRDILQLRVVNIANRATSHLKLRHLVPHLLDGNNKVLQLQTMHHFHGKHKGNSTN